MRRKIARWIHKYMSGDPSGYGVIPGSECWLDFGEGFTATTDGYEIWIARENKWLVFFSAKEARQLAWFILWDWWIVSTWFGLKRRIWYWSNREILKRYR